MRAYAHNLNNIGLSYNLDNQLVASNEASYSYDGFGHRVETIKGQARGITLYDESGLVFYEQSPDGTLSESLYLDDNRVVANHYKDNQKQTTYYHSDILGNVLAASDVSGQLLWRKLYEPYGKELLAPKTNSSDVQGFSGKRLDTSTGLLDFGARVYHPELGRFLSLDPAAVQADKPFSFNRYIYANNNPYKYKDPDGRNPILAIIGAGILACDGYQGYRADGWAGAARAIGKDLAIAAATGGAGKLASKGYSALKGLRAAGKFADTSARSAKQAANLSEHLTQSAKYGKDGVKELQNGRMRYYGKFTPARTKGEMAGARFVREWNPATGGKRNWYETYDHLGQVRSVAPKPVTNRFNHHIFDSSGSYVGRR